MKMRKKWHKPVWLLVAAFLNIQCIAAQEMHMDHAPSSKNEFLKIMGVMMEQMDKVSKNESKNAYFLKQMIPHHDGAVEMAKYEILHGKNAEMIQLAKSILAEQQTEIIQMKQMLESLSIQDPINDSFIKSMDSSMETMMKDLPKEDDAANIDERFAATMLPHHQAAIDMAKLVVGTHTDLSVNAFAKMLISNEQIEIDQMSSYLKKS